MDTKLAPTTKPTFEDVRQLFEKWRKERQQRSPVPEDLWVSAINLFPEYSISAISKDLRLQYSALKKRVKALRSDHVPESLTSHDFIELGLQTPISAAECIMETESGDGSKMKISIKGVGGVDPLDFFRIFLGR
jgi:hypothetical protein